MKGGSALNYFDIYSNNELFLKNWNPKSNVQFFYNYVSPFYHKVYPMGTFYGTIYRFKLHSNHQLFQESDTCNMNKNTTHGKQIINEDYGDDDYYREEGKQIINEDCDDGNYYDDDREEGNNNFYNDFRKEQEINNIYKNIYEKGYKDVVTSIQKSSLPPEFIAIPYHKKIVMIQGGDTKNEDENNNENNKNNKTNVGVVVFALGYSGLNTSKDDDSIPFYHTPMAAPTAKLFANQHPPWDIMAEIVAVPKYGKLTTSKFLSTNSLIQFPINEKQVTVQYQPYLISYFNTPPLLQVVVRQQQSNLSTSSRTNPGDTESNINYENMICYSDTDWERSYSNKNGVGGNNNKKNQQYGIESFSYRIIIVHSKTKTILRVSEAVTQKIYVIHRNRKPFLSVKDNAVSKKKVWNIFNSNSGSGSGSNNNSDSDDVTEQQQQQNIGINDLEPKTITLNNKIIRYMDTCDVDIANNVRIRIYTSYGFVTLNGDYKHLADFKSCRYRSLSPWQCINNGTMSKYMTFITNTYGSTIINSNDESNDNNNGDIHIAIKNRS